MAYIGKTPVIGNFQVCDAITVVDAQAAYTMQVGGVNVSPESANHMLVSLNGILQAPTSSFTVSGSTITFASALETGDVIDFIQILGNVLDLGVPSDNTVTTAKLADSSVSLAKLTATGTKDATTFLRGDNTFNTPPLGGITEADQWRLTAQASGDQTPISSNLERADTDGFGYIGTGMSQSSGIFTFPSTGVWKIEFDTHFSYNGSTRQIRTYIMTTTDNSSYSEAAYSNSSIVQAESNYTAQHGHASFIFNVTNTTTHKVRFDVDSSVTILTQADTDSSQTYMTFIRLGDSV
jgi:hypothetical protein